MSSFTARATGAPGKGSHRRTTKTRTKTKTKTRGLRHAQGTKRHRADTRIVSVAVHDHGNEPYPHCMLLHSDGTVSGIGNNRHGQLGLGDTRNRKAFTTLSSVSNVTAIASGEAHTVFLHRDGTVSTVGSNEDAQLGRKTTEGDRPGVPRKPQLHARVTAIACGFSHTVLLHVDGRVSMSGWNRMGQLGQSSTRPSEPAFQVIPRLQNITAIASAANTVLALHRNGTVSAWGEDGAGMGLGRCTTTKNLGIKCEHVDSPHKIRGLKNVVALGATGYHGLFLHKDGTVSSVGGDNQHGQLGVGDTKPHLVPCRIKGLRNVAQLSGDFNSSAAVHNDGNISVWGNSANYSRHPAIRKRLDPKNGVLSLLTPMRVPPYNRAAVRAVHLDSIGLIYVTRSGSVRVLGKAGASVNLTRIFQPPRGTSYFDWPTI